MMELLLVLSSLFGTPMNATNSTSLFDNGTLVVNPDGTIVGAEVCDNAGHQIINGRCIDLRDDSGPMTDDNKKSYKDKPVDITIDPVDGMMQPDVGYSASNSNNEEEPEDEGTEQDQK